MLSALASALPLLEAEREARRVAKDTEARLAVIEAEKRANYKIHRYFPAEGPLRRELYPQHMQFIRAGATYPERCFMAGNRTGKTLTAAFEIAHHLTGEYPDWWPGRRFTTPGDWWVAGKDGKTTRDIPQLELWGPPEMPQTGMIPAHRIVGRTSKPGIPNGLETISVRHVSGGVSTVQFKSFDQGRDSFQGTAKQGIWLDEECPADVYTECLLRTMTTDGIVIVTFTPLMGITQLIEQWLRNGVMHNEVGELVNAYKHILGDLTTPAELIA